MGLIFWIDENTFATSLVERSLKGQGLEFYTISNAQDFAYLINDLKPQIVVIDTKTVLRHLDLFKAQYLDTQAFLGASLVLIGNGAEFEFLENIKAEISRPFDPFTLKEFFSKI